MKQAQNIRQLIKNLEGDPRTALMAYENGIVKSYTAHLIKKTVDYLSNKMVSDGLGENDKVILTGRNSFNLVVHYFAILNIKAIPVLVNPSFTGNLFEEIFHRTKAKAIFYEEPLKNCGIEKLFFKTFYIVDLEQVATLNYKADLEDDKVEAGRPATIITSTGTSGLIKLVELSNENFFSLINIKLSEMQVDSKSIRHLILNTLTHMSGLSNLLLVFAGRGLCILCPGHDILEISIISKEAQPNIITSVPTLISKMKLFLNNNPALKNSFDSIKMVNFTSAPLNKHLLSYAKSIFRGGLYFVNRYGSTEAGGGLFGPHPEGLATPELSVGFPRKELSYKLIDGVLMVKGESVSQNILTARGEISLDKDGYYNTGDVFDVDDKGFYYFKGRLNQDLINCGGYKFMASDIEAIVLNHPQVLDCKVVAIDDRDKGQKPYAFVLLQEKNSETTEAHLIDYCLKLMPAYMHPRKIFILQDFPLNSLGKVNKEHLKKMVLHFINPKGSNNE